VNIKNYFEGKLLKNFYNFYLTDSDIENQVAKYSKRDYYLFFIVDKVTCLKCLYSHCNKLKNLSDSISIFVYSSQYSKLIKSEVPKSIILKTSLLQELNTQYKKLNSYNMFILLISKSGQIIYFEVINPEFLSESLLIYNKIKRYQ